MLISSLYCNATQTLSSLSSVTIAKKRKAPFALDWHANSRERLAVTRAVRDRYLMATRCN